MPNFFRTSLIFFLIICQLVIWPSSQLFAHVCDDVLRQDPIVIWPEGEIIEIQKTGQFKIFLRNDYWDSINQVKLIPPPESPFKIWVVPSLIERVAPKEKTSFLVNLTIPQGIKPGFYPLLMKIDAREFRITRDINLTIIIKEPPLPPKPLPEPEPEAVVEIIPEEIPVAISVFPDEIDIEPEKSTEFKVYIRSGYDKPLTNITLLIDEVVFKEFGFEMKVQPEAIQELGPEETKFFLINLKVPAEAKMGEYIMPLYFKADELPVERHVCDVLIRVGEVWEWKTYFYLLIILLIIFITIWRWRKLSQTRLKLRPKQ
jgi:hypothetical protein